MTGRNHTSFFYSREIKRLLYKTGASSQLTALWCDEAHRGVEIRQAWDLACLNLVLLCVGVSLNYFLTQVAYYSVLLKLNGNI